MRNALLTLGLVLLLAPIGQTDEGEVDLTGVPEADRVRVSAILERPSLSVPLGEERVEATVEIYEFLLARLDFTAAIVRRFRLGGYSITRMNDSTFHVDDHRGAVADIRRIGEYAHGRGGTRHIYLAVGFFEILRGLRVYGEGVIILDYEPDGERHLRTDAEIFFKVRNETLDRLSRLAQRALRVVVRDKAALFVVAAKQASELVAADPERVNRMMSKGSDARPEDLESFRKAFLP